MLAPLHITTKWTFYLLTLSLLSLTVFMFTLTSIPIIMLEWQMENINSSTPSFSMIIDTRSALLMFTVMFISSNIMLFSKSYMSNNTLKRFYFLVLLFVASMNLFIMSPNFMGMLLGWDGLGITSFLLVIYYQTPEALGAGLITMFTNRIGDSMVLLLITMNMNQGTWNMFSSFTNNKTIYLLILLAAMTKSAQIPFHLWLPEAMAAPTPVSALVHSSTLVTAGVYFIIRTYPIFSSDPSTLLMIMYIGSLTAFIASSSAATILDPKKIIAYSTMSQLGIMVASVGFGSPHFAFFHLITHAMFKALMFICAGMFISSKMHSQSLRSISARHSSLLTASSFKISALSLNAFPFLGGYYSKDMILESLVFKTKVTIPFLLILWASILTATYTARLIRGGSTTHRHNLHSNFNIHEKELYLLSPLLMLSIGSIIMGSSILWLSFYSLNSTYISWPHNILVAFVPYMGVSFAWSTCSMFIKSKKGPYNNNTSETPNSKSSCESNLPIMQNTFLLSCVMHSDPVVDSRTDTNTGMGVWNLIFLLNKYTLKISFIILKYVETTMLEHLLPMSTGSSLLLLSKKILSLNKPFLIPLISTMIILIPLIIMLLL